MEIHGGSGLAIGSVMKRKRSRVSLRPRANSDALFQSYFGWPSFIEPFDKYDGNENLRDTAVASGVGTENRMKKVKLKFGGVTRAIYTKSKIELASNFSPHFYGPKPQDDTDGNYACPLDKRKGIRDQLQKLSSTESGFTAENLSYRGKTFRESMTVNHEAVRKSKRIPMKHALDVGFSDEENEDAELQFLERLNASKVSVGRNNDHQGTRTDHGTCKGAERCQIDGLNDYGAPGSRKDCKKKLKSDKKYDDQDYMEEENPTSDDGSISEKKPKKGSVDLLVGQKQCTLVTRNRSVSSCKDVFTGSDASIINTSDDLIPTLSQRKKGKLSEMEQQLKKAEAAQRRKMQSEKAAREAEAEAIRKILGQDSGRKKKEEKMKKRQNEIAQEKSSNSFNLGLNTVRWNIGPTGTVVTFSEDIGLPSIFQTVPNSYPPPREKCAGPNCTNVYKYRDSKSKLPLCSLNCYRAIHEKMQPLITC